MSFTYNLTSSNNIILRSDGVYIPNSPGNLDWENYQLWLAQNNTPSPVAVISPVTTCYLWQLEAYLSTNQWANVMSYISSSNNANLIAFAAHGSNMIPSNSTTLSQLAIVIGIDQNSIYSVVANASNIVIP